MVVASRTAAARDEVDMREAVGDKCSVVDEVVTNRETETIGEQAIANVAEMGPFRRTFATTLDTWTQTCGGCAGLDGSCSSCSPSCAVPMGSPCSGKSASGYHHPDRTSSSATSSGRADANKSFPASTQHIPKGVARPARSGPWVPEPGPMAWRAIQERSGVTTRNSYRNTARLITLPLWRRPIEVLDGST